MAVEVVHFGSKCGANFKFCSFAKWYHVVAICAGVEIWADSLCMCEARRIFDV